MTMFMQVPCGEAAEIDCAPPPPEFPHPDLQALLVTNYTALHRRLTRYLGCADAASESLHEAWMKLAGVRFEGTLQSPVAYIYRVACNAATDRLRAERPWQFTGAEEDMLEHLADHAPGPALIAEARSDLQAVERAMQVLPNRHQDILVALRVHELTRQEVAVRHGLSLRRVDTTLRQALLHLSVLPVGRFGGQQSFKAAAEPAA